MKNTQTPDLLKKALADTYLLYLKTQNYHWNVTGPQFNSLHTLFETQYTDLAAAVDVIAERIRALGHKAPGSMKAYAESGSIKDGDENAKALDMVRELAKDQERIGKTLTEALEAAKEDDDEVTIGLMVDRLTIHEKNRWMLEAHLEK